jgi:predicted nucleic acid-binding Zn finger protein|tara:strand:- start:7973 stop:8473 length:501 start_codon:yes stop_codon:yes gene_type:complete
MSPKPSGTGEVVGQFNSSKSPDIIWTVKEDRSKPVSDNKRIWCNCPSWRFSHKRLGRYECKHTKHIVERRQEQGETVALAQERVEREQFHNSELGKSLVGNKKRQLNSAKRKFAVAVQRSGVRLTDAAFKALLYELRPYLKNASEARLSTKAPVIDDDVLRVITLD